MANNDNLDRLTRADDGTIAKPRAKSNFMYRRQKIVGICTSLRKPCEEYSPVKTIESINDYIEAGDRIIYSEITTIVYAMSPEEQGTFNSNLETLMNYALSEESKTPKMMQDTVIRLWDHVHLAMRQIGNAREILEKSTAETKQSLHDELYKEFKGIEKEYITILGILVKGIYSANDNHYVIDVVNESATSKNEEMQITEKIVKPANQQYFDSKELNYEVELKNIMQENFETQVAMVIDTSYSMGINDAQNAAKTKAKELASGILNNVKNSRISVSNNNNVKLNMTSTKTDVTTNIKNINNQINALKDGEGSDSNIGLDNAYKTFTTPLDSKNCVTDMPFFTPSSE